MKLKLALLALTALGAASALPASAQSYNSCENTRKNAQAGGAVLGAVIGGLIGSNVSARGHRGDGTAVGAGLGALTGLAAGSSTRCGSDYTGPVYGPGYGPAPYPVASAPPPPPAYNDGYLDGGPGYEDSREYYRGRLDDRHADTYKYHDDYAGRECKTVTQTTRLPDGTRIRKPVQACRDMRYGDWDVDN